MSIYVPKIIQIARGYIGQTETVGNSGFTHPDFQQKMTAVGWAKSLAWCSFFGELVWTEAYAGTAYIPEIKRLFSASATTTYKNFDIAPGWEVGMTPMDGALAIFRHGSGWQGHLGIVVDASEVQSANAMHLVEGNTNDKGGREGYIVAAKTRKVKQPYQPNGLNLVGFVYAK